jgi:hypothetical protein
MVAGPAGIARLARQHPASYLAFDLLPADGQDLRPRPWRDRRAALEAIGPWRPPLQLSPYTTDPAEATDWFRDYPGATGVEGLVAKGAGDRYRPGARGWVKIKSRASVDGVIGRQRTTRPSGGPNCRPLHQHRCAHRLRPHRPLTAQARDVASVITAAPAAGHPWPAEISSGHFGGGRVTLTNRHHRPDPQPARTRRPRSRQPVGRQPSRRRRPTPMRHHRHHHPDPQLASRQTPKDRPRMGTDPANSATHRVLTVRAEGRCPAGLARLRVDSNGRSDARHAGPPCPASPKRSVPAAR